MRIRDWSSDVCAFPICIVAARQGHVRTRPSARRKGVVIRTKGRRMSLFDMSGQVALITGSSRGIGKATAEAMAEQGAKVVISSRKQDACDATAAEINAKFGDGTAISVAANISSRSEEHTSELQSLMRNSYAVFCLKKKN